MRMISKGRVSLLGVMLASVGAANAARETVSLTRSDITFTIARYDDGRNKPYRLKFKQDGTRSLYMFDSASIVTDIKVGTERFEVLYDASDNLESVELTSTTRRTLAEDKHDAAAMEGRRLEFAYCADCVEGMDAVCAGVTSVCNLVDYGPPFSATAAASVVTMCEDFERACFSYDRTWACEEQCEEEEEEEEEESDSAVNRCLSPTNADYKCTFTGETTINFSSCDLTDDDIPLLPACFEEFGKLNLVKLDLDELTLTTIPEGTFAGLSELTSLDLYSNRLVTVPEGLFSDLTKLEFLDMAYNDLTSLPEGAFSGLTSLLRLRLFSNELRPEALPLGLFSTVPQLTSLSLDSNSLADLTSLVGLFDGLTELTHLSLSDAGVKTVPEGLFAGLTKLEYLSFWSNSITTLPDGLLSDLTALQTLELSENEMTDLGTSLSGLTELRKLLLGYNDVVLTEDIFADLVNLEELDLQYCELTTLPAGIFSPMVNLVSIDLWGNDDLQCLPTTSATDVDLSSEDVRDGTCECTPVEAVSCDDGSTCQSGTTGYTCDA